MVLVVFFIFVNVHEFRLPNHEDIQSIQYSLFIMKCQHDNEERMRRLERYRTETGKQKRVQRKINHAEEQELRLVIHDKV